MSLLPTASSLPTEISSLNATFYQDVRYQGHGSENVFDFYKPIGGAALKPVVFLFHGGGFISGDKSAFYLLPLERSIIEGLIDADIAVVAPNYRLISEDNTETVGVRKCLQDGTNVVQRVLFNSVELGIDKTKVGFYGRSAGSAICMFLCGKDRANPNTSGYKSESTRPIAVSARRPQPLDLPGWGEYFTTLTFEDMLTASVEIKDRCYNFYGMIAPVTPDIEDFKTKSIYNYANALDTVRKAIPAGISLQLINYDSSSEPTTFDDLIHHPNFSQAWKNKWDAAGIPCDFYTSEPPAESEVDFLIRILNA